MPQPQVDDQFWFEHSKSLVSNAVSKRDEATQRIQSLTAWLWTIYTASVTVGVSKLHFSTTETIQVLIPIPSLLAVYWIAAYAQMPVNLTFDPRSPDEIRQAYVGVVKKKGTLIWWAMFISLISVLFLVNAIKVVSSASNLSRQGTRFSSFELRGVRYLALDAQLDGSTPVQLEVRPVKAESPGARVLQTAVTDSNGRIQMTVPISRLLEYEAVLTWKSTQSEQTFKQIVK